MNITEAVIRRWAHKDRLTALSIDVPFGSEPKDFDRLWWFSSAGKPLEGLQGICEPELTGFLHQWGELTKQEADMVDMELYGEVIN